MPRGVPGVVAGVILLILAGLAAWMWMPVRGGAASQDFPDGIRMLCSDEECGNVFYTTIKEIARVRAEDDAAPIPCPRCGGASVRGRECPSCHGTFPESMARGTTEKPACPLCHEPLPKLSGG